MESTVTDHNAAPREPVSVLITGGAGFIGSHVADTLLAQGHRVTVVDNLVTGRRDNVNPQARFVEMDICRHDFQALYAEVKPAYVIHAAASYKDPSDHWSDARTNVQGCVQVGRLAKQHGTTRVVYFETALCYGLNPATPVMTDHALSPWDTSYALSKTVGERYLELADIPLTVFRLAHICGPRNLSGPIPTFFRKLTAGEPCKITDSRRDFVHVGDLVEVVQRVVNGRAPMLPRRQKYHISSGKDLPIKLIYDYVAKAMGKLDGQWEFLARGDDDAKTILLDTTDTRLVFKWTPQVSVPDSIAQAVEWYRKNGVTQTFTHLRAAQ